MDMDMSEFSEEFSSSEQPQLSLESSGKELDLYHHASWSIDGDVDDRVRNGVAGGMRGRAVGGEGPGEGGMRFPAERTSYMFCPVAHGMMR